MNILATPLGLLMKGCYLLVKNYGIALLLFTVLTRLITLPVNIKQQISTQKMTMLQPEIEKLKKKYAKNQEKLNEETMKLYAEHNANPMASCLPMLIPLVLLWAMIPVVYKPLTYITDANNDNIKTDEAFMRNAYTICAEVDKQEDRTIESLLADAGEDDEQRAEKLGELLVEDKGDDTPFPNSKKLIESLSESEKEDLLGTLAKKENEGLDTFMTDPDNFTENMMRNTYGSEALMFNFHTKGDGKFLKLLHGDVQSAIKEFDYTAFGLDLGRIPSKANATAAIPIISCVLQLVTTVISQIFSKKNNPDMKMGAMLPMLILMPIFSLYIGFKFPCALGLYWIYSSAWAVIQVLFLNIFYSPAKIKELAAKDAEKAKAKRKKKGPSFMEKALEVSREQAKANQPKKSSDEEVAEYESESDDDDNDNDDDDDDRKLSKAERNARDRKKLNEARKRYAEKYGDEYTED